MTCDLCDEPATVIDQGEQLCSGHALQKAERLNPSPKKPSRYDQYVPLRVYNRHEKEWRA